MIKIKREHFETFFQENSTQVVTASGREFRYLPYYVEKEGDFVKLYSLEGKDLPKELVEAIKDSRA